MGHIPNDAKWWYAELVEEITVQGDSRNVVHRNVTLIRADSSEEAYSRALELGKNGETSYLNLAGREVQIRFRGIAELDVIDEELDDGAELMFFRSIGMAEKELQALIKPKDKLNAFVPPRGCPEEGVPDYGAANVIREALRMMEDNS